MPLNIFRKAISWAYLTFIPFMLISEGVWKTKIMELKSSDMFNSISSLKSKNKTLIFHFSKLVQFISTEPLNILYKVRKSVHLTFSPLSLVSGGAWKSKNYLCVQARLRVKYPKATLAFNIFESYFKSYEQYL